MEYEKGLIEVADGVFAYLQPDGGWGWSNAGLVVGDDESLLVDTLFDLKLTAEMLGEMAPITGAAPIGTLVNTHANGDHCYGNSLVAGAEVVASAASAQEMDELPPAALAALMRAEVPPATRRYLDVAFGPFTFDGIPAPTVDTTFERDLELTVGGRAVSLDCVGPAHTAGDSLVSVPESGVIFCGDILFIGGTPIVWNGPVSNWTAACDAIVASGASVIVPGHGPLTDVAGVTAVADYLRWVEHEATVRFEGGMSAADAARDIDLGPYRDWLDSERIAINVDTIYRHLDPSLARTDVVSLFGLMAELAGA